jgi:glycosyltransferase involved in cell wall biosynthesis
MTGVSVLTPSYQYGRFLGDAMASVAAQVGMAVEHVVQDAESTDETSTLLENADPRVSWRREPDQGQSDGLNRALRRAKGDWIAWLNADEFYLPGALAAVCAAAESAGADAAYADVLRVDEEGRLMRLFAQHPFDERVLRGYGTYIPSCTFVVRRTVLGSDPWDVSLQRIMDYDLFLRLATEGATFAYVPRVVAAYRVHDAQQSLQSPDVYIRELSTVRARYGLPDPGPAGRWRHRLLKLRGGAHLRELAWSRHRGTSMLWFDG